MIVDERGSFTSPNTSLLIVGGGKPSSLANELPLFFVNFKIFFSVTLIVLSGDALGDIVFICLPL